MRSYAQKQNQPQAWTTPVIKPPAAHLHRKVNNEEEQKPAHAADSSKINSDNIAATRFAHDFSRIPVRSNVPVRIQTKLAVNKTGDTYEQEADRISEQVMNIHEPQLRHDSHIQLQTKRVHTNDTEQTIAPPLVDAVLQSSGQPLDASTRQFMESRFAHDFSRVRVHTDLKAAQSAAAVNAQAYTVGRDIVFGAGHYTPETTAGKKLLAHELTHAIQQSNGLQTKLAINAPDDQYEQEAEHAALTVTQGETTPVNGQAGARVMRQSAKQEPDDPPPFIANHPAPYGPFLLPEVVITATRTAPPAVGTYNMQAAADVSFVKVETIDEAVLRMETLNRLAVEELLKQNYKNMGTISEGDPNEIKRKENEKAQKILKDQFGEGWGTFFWWTRGGGETGEGSPLWKILPAARGFNRGYPPPAYPYQRLVYPDTRGTAVPTESTK